jgi:uncharacterized damage-inducible protein DinB
VSVEPKIVEKAMRHALSGEGSHVGAKHIFEGLDWAVTGERPSGAPHSLFQLLNHLIYWQDWVLSWLDGDNPPIPEAAGDSWPGSVGPPTEEVWQESMARFTDGVDGMTRRTARAGLFSKGYGEKTRLEMLQVIASHNSYHLGQVVFLRQMLGAWPPPTGGLTW